MAYENINSASLKKSLSQVTDISPNKVNNLINKLSRSEWRSIGQIRVSNALREIASEINKLKSDASNYKNASIYIEKCKNEQQNLRKYRGKVSEYEYYLRNCPANNQVARNNYTNALNNYRRKVRESETNIRKLQNQINSLIK